MAIGLPRGQIKVIHIDDDGSVHLNGVTVKCNDCGRFWFANPKKDRRKPCPLCGSLTGGGSLDIEMSYDLHNCGIETAWFGDFDYKEFRNFASPVSPNLLYRDEAMSG